jgi:hypothetical protein
MIKYRQTVGDADVSGLLEASEISSSSSGTNTNISRDRIVSVYPKLAYRTGRSNLALGVVYRDEAGRLQEMLLEREDWCDIELLDAMFSTYRHFHSTVLDAALIALTAGGVNGDQKSS